MSQLDQIPVLVVALRQALIGALELGLVGDRELGPRERDSAAAALVNLAVRGHLLWRALLSAAPGLDKIGSLNRISVARNPRDGWSVPWAALYDRPVNVQASLCALFETELLAGRDLLDEPAQCHARSECPLRRGDRGNLTLCPFGFWGLRREIEQSDSVESSTTPRELRTRVVDRDSKQIRLAFISWPFASKERHLAELKERPMAVTEAPNPETALQVLAKGDEDVLYFFCHGGVDKNGMFSLFVGPSKAMDEKSQIAPYFLRGESRVNAPLVFLNGCDTMGPAALASFVRTLRHMGAAAVIGTEIPVDTALARRVAQLVLDGMLAGQTLGRAFLNMRKAMLRRLSPLGLAYAFDGPAELVLHSDVKD